MLIEIPQVGDQAWQPVDDFLERSGGPPKLATVHGSGFAYLYWLVGHHPAAGVSCWLYVSLAPADLEALATCDTSDDVLRAVVLGVRDDRDVRVAAAGADHRIVSTYEWVKPRRFDEVRMRTACLASLAEELRQEADRDLPAAQADVLRTTAVAVQELADLKHERNRNQLAIDLPPVTDIQDQDGRLGVANRVDDAVVADPKPPER